MRGPLTLGALLAAGLAGCSSDQEIDSPSPLSASVPIEYPLDLWDQGIEGSSLLKVRVDRRGGGGQRDRGGVQRSRRFRLIGRARRQDAQVQPRPKRGQADHGVGSCPGAFLEKAASLSNNPLPYDNITEVVGSTPLIRLNSVNRGDPGTLYVKCEFMNPGGSVKDRIGLAMVEAAEREGRLKPGGVIVEATSGNTGMALAMVAAIRGYRCIFTMPDKMSQEKVKLLRSFGAEVVIVPTAVPPDHPEHYTVKAQTIARETPGAILADQFYNPANAQAHYETTGPEIWEQTEGEVTHFFAGAGTGGTITGVGRYLKEQNPDVQIVGVDPAGSILKAFFDSGEMTTGEPYKVEGLGSDKIPGALDMSVTDRWVTVTDAQSVRDDAPAGARRGTLRRRLGRPSRACSGGGGKGARRRRRARDASAGLG